MTTVQKIDRFLLPLIEQYQNDTLRPLRGIRGCVDRLNPIYLTSDNDDIWYNINEKCAFCNHEYHRKDIYYYIDVYFDMSQTILTYPFEGNRDNLPVMCETNGLKYLVCKNCTEIIRNKVQKMYHEYQEQNDYVLLDSQKSTITQQIDYQQLYTALMNLEKYNLQENALVNSKYFVIFIWILVIYVIYKINN